MLRCYYMDISCDCSNEQSQALYNLLPEERQLNARRMKNAALAKKRILSGAFLQYVLSLILDIPVVQITYQYGEFGKPMLTENVMSGSGAVPTGEKIDFNLSHSGKFAVLAVSDVSVGIDVECCKKNRMSVAKRCFNREEYEDIVAAGTDAERDRRFLEYWTMKEAYVKCLGEGLCIPLDSFLIRRREDFLSYVQMESPKQSMYFATGFLDEKYCVSVCSSNRQELEELKMRENLPDSAMLQIRLEDILHNLYEQ